MSDIIFPSPVRAVDGNGNPVPGARAYFYASGTSTPATVFADASENVPHPSPLLADAAGVFPPVYKGGQPLRVLVTDADGVTLPGFPIDPVLTAPAGGGAAQTISFNPTPQIPVTNVQAAIEQVQQNITEPLVEFGLGVIGMAPILANIDATNTPVGHYRWTDTSTGTIPIGWEGHSGTIEFRRETASNAYQSIRRRDIQQKWWRRLTEGVWSAWFPEVRYVTNPTDASDATPALWSGSDVAAMVGAYALGVGQEWRDPGRSVGTQYTNSTGRPIMVVVKGSGNVGALEVHNGSAWAVVGEVGGSPYHQAYAVVPHGRHYRVTGNPGIVYWRELY